MENIIDIANIFRIFQKLRFGYSELIINKIKGGIIM